MSSINSGTINNAAKGNEPLRTVLNAIHAQLGAIAQGTGVSLLEPTSGGAKQKPVTATPPTASLSVTGSNGIFNASIINPPQTIPATIYHQIQYADNSSFGNPATLPTTSATLTPLPMPGATYYFRIRSSVDQINFNAWSPAMQNPVESGLQSSAASSNASVLNQTNYATIDSVASGSTASIRIYGKAGPGFPYPALKGSVETILPSATIVGAPYSTNLVVAYDGDAYSVRRTLPQVLADGMTPTGNVSVVGSGAVVLPTVALVLDGSGHVIAWDVETQGNGLTAAVALSIVTSTGSGATPGAQTISGGKLISIAPGNPGQTYSGSDTVMVSGGTSAGASGGGQSIGGNNGRLIYQDPTTAVA